MTATQWIEVILSYSLQVLIVVMVAHFADQRASDAKVRNTIWSMCFWSILLLACAAILLPRLHVLRPWSWVHPKTLLTIGETQLVVGRLLLALWCLGATVALLRWMKRGYMLRQILHHCETLSVAKAASLLNAATPRSSESKHPRVLVSDEIEGPFCWQFHQPTIVLPRFLLDSSPEDLAHVVAHEVEHLETNHPLQLFLQRAVQVVCWFHPAVWQTARHASLVREFSCDDAGVAVGANTAAYLRTLLRIAERSECKSGSLGFGRNRNDIVIRSRRLVAIAQGCPGAPRQRMSAFAASTLLCLTTFLASQFWLPVDVLASSHSRWSPWPTWSATTLHTFGIAARDFEEFDHRVQIHELREDFGSSTVEEAAQRPF